MMYVLHGHWQPPTDPTDTGVLLLWLENGTQKRPRKRKPPTKAAAHPFADIPDQLFDLLAATGLIETGKTFKVWQAIYTQLFGHTPHTTNSGQRLRPDRITLYLPTGTHGPIPSPQLAHSWQLPAATPVLAPWTIQGLALTPQDSLTFLQTLPDPNNLPPGMTLGPDLRYWQQVTEFALSLLAGQRIIPTLSQADAAGQTFHARWLPVLDAPADARHFQQLQATMPPLCRAALPADDPAAAIHPARLIESFLNVAIDTHARLWGGGVANLRVDKDDPTAAWLGALFTPNPAISAPASQLRRLWHSFKIWLRNLHLAGSKNSRVAFRLEAPAGQPPAHRKAWTLHFALQARSDPSLLVSAADVWQTKSDGLNRLDHHFEQPQETLLTGLGYAARLFPPLKATLKQGKPAALNLTTADAFDFLRNVAPLLEESGFGVLVPPWWQSGAKLGVRVKMSAGQSKAEGVATGLVSFEKLIAYDWELSLGETSLSREEFKTLAALKTPLVQIRGQWVHLDAAQIDTAINFWEKQAAGGETNLFEAMQMALGAEQAHGLPVVDVQLDEWLTDWTNRFNRTETMTTLPAPQTLQATLRPYQEYGYTWLDFMRRWGMGACLADDMGLGKTIQTLTMLLRHKELNGQLPGPVLLISPTSVVSNWAIEARRFTPGLQVMVHQGADRLRDDALVEAVAGLDMTLTSYALARRDVDALRKVSWFGVILDEAQNIKNPSAKQTQAIRSLEAGFRLALTGTPVENRLSELWSIMNFLNPGYLGSQKAFRNSYARPIERYQDEAAAERLRRLTTPFILRRLKTDPTVIRDLPEKNEMKVYCNLSQEQATLYESVVQTSIAAIEGTGEAGIERKGLVLSMLMKLKQICNHPAQFLHQVGEGQQLNLAAEMRRSGKLARLTQMLEESLSVGDRCLIFTQFTEMGDFLQRYLPQKLGAPTIFLHGGVPAKKRAEMVKQFQEDAAGPPIFLLSLKAGGTGLNLTRANHVFHFDRWWNPAVEDQATDRAFRIGQKRNVQVHKFITAGTLEEMIDEMIERKKALANKVVGQGEGWLTELSTDDLRDLVTLRQEAFQ